MRSHRRRQPTAHVVIAGTLDDLDDVCAAVALLPSDAYGQVFIHAPASAELYLATPSRVSVHRVHDNRSLCEAIAGWIAEWIPEEHDAKRRVAVWIGNHARCQLATTQEDFGWRVDNL